MKGKVYHYSVLRFMPFIETREFVNVGVALISPETGQLIFKLASTRFARVSQFFDSLDNNLYKNSIEMFQDELKRTQDYCQQNNVSGKRLIEHFKELVRRRESVLHFGDFSTLVNEKTSVDVLNDLYERFIAPISRSKKSREQEMARALRRDIERRFAVNYTEKELTVGHYKFKIPLVYQQSNRMSVIKPLAFEQRTALKALEHGEVWIRRIQKLVKQQMITYDSALFTLESPNDTGFSSVYHEIEHEISKLGFSVCDMCDSEKIHHFAKSQQMHS